MWADKKKSKFAAWQDQNPKGTFKQFYAERLSKALAGEKRHSSIGPSLKKKGLHKTHGIFSKLVASGLKPSDVFVDFGCGTLRVGASLIEYLEPDRYIGFDIDEKILDVGREMLPPGVRDAKRPRLAVVSPQSLSEASALHPQWIFSKGVLQHVPPSEIGEFFENLASVMHPETVGVLGRRSAPRTSRSPPIVAAYHRGFAEGSRIARPGPRNQSARAAPGLALHADP